MPRSAPLRATPRVIEPLESRMMLSATILHVNTTADIVDSGDAFLSLREAVLAANASSGDEEIVLPAGHYELTRPGANEDFGQTGDLDVRDNGSLKIIGAGRDETIIDAGPLMVEALGYGDRIFHVHEAAFEMRGLSVTGGTQGAFTNAGGQVVIRHSVIQRSVGTAIRNVADPARRSHPSMIIEETLVADNSAVNGGGGVINTGDLFIVNSEFLRNSASFQGGAILAAGNEVLASHLYIINSRFEANEASEFGGAIAQYMGELVIRGSYFVENSANGGGAVMSTQAILEIRESHFLYNRANSGGAIGTNSTTTIEGSTIAHNTVTNAGGGIAGYAKIVNSTISHNRANKDGGGLDGEFAIENSTITANVADADGDGIGLGGGLSDSYRSSFRNTIVAGNLRGMELTQVPNDLDGNFISASFSLIGDPSSAGGLSDGANGNMIGDGLGGVLDVGTILDTNLADNGGPTLSHALLPNSPAVNSGDPNFAAAAVPHDQRGAGFARVSGGRVDIGALEFGSLFQSVVSGRHVFYNNSSFDDEDPGINHFDLSAIATNKHALLPDGMLADSSNVTSYSRGINGILVNLAGSHPDITADDFIFRVGASNDPASWDAAPAPSAIQVLSGQGVGGADRVVITWPDGAIKNTYLQVIVAANADTGLAQEDVFFFGNRVGDSFSNQPLPSFVTSAADELAARNTTSRSYLDVSNPLDFDKSGTISAADILIARNNGGFLPRIQIAPPALASPLASNLGANAITAALTSAARQEGVAPALPRPAAPRKPVVDQQRLVDQAIVLFAADPLELLIGSAGDTPDADDRVELPGRRALARMR